MRFIPMHCRLPLLMLVTAAALSACNDKNRTAYALTSSNTIIKFETNTPADIEAESTVSGLDSGESLIQIDYRPSNKGMYGITFNSSTANSYVVTVNPDSGVVTKVGTTAIPSSASSSTPITLTAPVVMDVNPVGDYLRIIDYAASTTGSTHNFRVNPDTGAFIQSDQLSTAPALYFNDNDTNSGEVPELAAIGHSNNVDDASSTTLYGLDVTTQSLVTIATSGQIKTVANCGHAFVSGNAGFDIVPDSDQAFAALGNSGENTVFYKVDLGSCNLDRVDEIGGSRRILSLAVTLEDNKNNND